MKIETKIISIKNSVTYKIHFCDAKLKNQISFLII